MLESRDSYKTNAQLLSRYTKLVEELKQSKQKEKQLQFQLDNFNGNNDKKRLELLKSPEVVQLLTVLEEKKKDIAKTLADRERTTRFTGMDPALRK